MSKRENYETRTEELLRPIAEANGVEIYDVEYVKEGSEWYLRCYIDKEEGVNINDCEAVSRALSDELDKVDFIEDAYILEVSSPGLGRQLKKDKHFQKSLLSEVDVKCYKPINGSKDFTGILKAFDENTLTLEMDSGKEKEDVTFNRKDIAAVKLTLDF
ncbi:MAG: ribosome maturation factor RimP [Lachnospiraceae bacterium]|nr:ribosome maturation factor RimP [Lachnospiraceae bacterium]